MWPTILPEPGLCARHYRAEWSRVSGRLVLLFGAMADKAVEEIAKILWPAMAHVVLTRIANNPRAAATADLAALAQSLGVEHSVSASVREGVELATARRTCARRRCVVVIAGSIYVAGEAVQALR